MKSSSIDDEKMPDLRGFVQCTFIEMREKKNSYILDIIGKVQFNDIKKHAPNFK